MSNTPADQGSAAARAENARQNRERDWRKAAAAKAAMDTIDELVALLREAGDYFIAGEDLAAWGTLLMFDDHAEDLKAAIRLHRSANRRAP